MQQASNPKLDAAEQILFQRLRRELEHQISGHGYEVPAGAIGSPLIADKFAIM